MRLFNPEYAIAAVVALVVFAAAAWGIGSEVDAQQRRRCNQ